MEQYKSALVKDFCQENCFSEDSFLFEMSYLLWENVNQNDEIFNEIVSSFDSEKIPLVLFESQIDLDLRHVIDKYVDYCTKNSIIRFPWYLAAEGFNMKDLSNGE